eukprot:EG_transcript_20688
MLHPGAVALRPSGVAWCLLGAVLLAWAVAVPLPLALHALAPSPTAAPAALRPPVWAAARTSAAGAAAELGARPVRLPEGTGAPHRTAPFPQANWTPWALLAASFAAGWAAALLGAHRIPMTAGLRGRWAMCAAEYGKPNPDYLPDSGTEYSRKYGTVYKSPYAGDYEPDERGTCQLLVDEVVVCEFGEAIYVGNGAAYFPPDTLRMEYFRPSSHTAMVDVMGETKYYDIVVNGKVYPNAAWYHVKPLDEELDVVAGWVTFDEDVVWY